VAFAYHGIPYTSREKVIDIGLLQASIDTKKTIQLPPILISIILLALCPIMNSKCSKKMYHIRK
jgi:hypothetical protein